MAVLVTRVLAAAPDSMAPDGSEVRLLAQAARGSMAHFTLLPGQVSTAVAHRTVEEVWYFLEGQGRMWRRHAEAEAVADVFAGVSIVIPTGAHFQFRCDGTGPLSAVGVTMPPWPGDEEAIVVPGIWSPTA